MVTPVPHHLIGLLSSIWELHLVAGRISTRQTPLVACSQVLRRFLVTSERNKWLCRDGFPLAHRRKKELHGCLRKQMGASVILAWLGLNWAVLRSPTSSVTFRGLVEIPTFANYKQLKTKVETKEHPTAPLPVRFRPMPLPVDDAQAPAECHAHAHASASGPFLPNFASFGYETKKKIMRQAITWLKKWNPRVHKVNEKDKTSSGNKLESHPLLLGTARPQVSHRNLIGGG